MKRTILLAAVLCGSSLLLPAQKSKVISVFQLIETAKYDEAKIAIEEAIGDEKTWRWPKTWYTRGYLCQIAYEKGIAENDKKKFELYPDQLYVAYDSYQRALSLDNRDRLDGQIAPLYIQLANDFQKMGEKHFNRNDYEEALRAFEHALQVSRSPIISVRIDTNLVYNTALAAYRSQEWVKAIGYLSALNNKSYSSNTAILLFTAYLENGDTISAENVLIDGIDRYRENETLVLLMADLLLQTDDPERAVAVLDRASVNEPSNFKFPYTKGLVHQKTGHYEEAIKAYEAALVLAPGDKNIYANVGTCYYNIGVEIEEYTRTISNNRRYQEEKARSKTAYENAVVWLEQAYEIDPDNQKVIIMLYQLYKVLQITDKIKSMENRIG